MSNVEVKKKKKSPLVYVILAIVVIAAFFGIRAWIHGLSHESTDNAQIEARAVPVISRVSGYIDSVGVTDFGAVENGQVLIKIDDTEYALAVIQARANLLNTRADLANAEAVYRNSLMNKKLALANAAVQKTKLDKAMQDLARDEALYKEGAVTQKQVEDSRSAKEELSRQYEANQVQVNVAVTQIGTAEAQVQKAGALIEIQQAVLDQALLKLSYCTIKAPVRGRIGKRNIEAGQYIQAGAPLFSVVNNEHYWLVANFKETQLEKMKEGQPVHIVLDGYPDEEMEGVVASFSQATGAKFSLLPPDNATGNFVKITQRVPVKIDIVDEAKYSHVLRAGLSADVEVKIR